jgi:predicted nucleic acid-binding protein
MPSPREIVVNTGPLLALIAGVGDLSFLTKLYHRVAVPCEVANEIRVGGKTGFGLTEFQNATFLEIASHPVTLLPVLQNTLDLGEASVIQTALDQRIPTVCIDEPAGRRIARLHGLLLTGSLGIIVKATLAGEPFDVPAIIQRMQQHGIWISDRTKQDALMSLNRGTS